MSSNDLFEAISHPLRIDILKILAKKPHRFADIKRMLKINSSGLLDFHLKKLGDLVNLDAEGRYIFNRKGVCRASSSGGRIKNLLAKEGFLPEPHGMHSNKYIFFTS
ncbi:MAG: helix-turn-helix domain-containing protein [Candidatus Bathyarchaeia archaeon]